MRDHWFSRTLHGDPRLVDIVDEQWVKELEFDDIQVSDKDKPRSVEDELDQDTVQDSDVWKETLQFKCVKR